MTVSELEERLSTTEYFEWIEWFQMQHEAQKKAAEKAKAQSARMPRRRY